MKRRITKGLLGIYCLVLIWIILCKVSFSFDEIKALVGERSINLIPFYYADEVIRLHGREVLLNILVFVPFGVYLKMLGMLGGKAVLYGLFFSFALELCQFALAVGASDITDLITNTLGVFGGVCAYSLLGKLFRNKEKRDAAIHLLSFIALSLFLLTAIFLFLANR